MPRYFFHTHDTTTTIDTNGQDLDDERAARVFMVGLASEILRNDAKNIAEGQYWRIEATDESGRLVFCFSLLPLDPKLFPDWAIKSFPFK